MFRELPAECVDAFVTDPPYSSGGAFRHVTWSRSRMTFTVKALVSDIYLDDLRDKTLRGLEGHALAGLSTGGGLYGYRSVEISRDAKKRRCRVEIDDAKAAVVRRVFDLYLRGQKWEVVVEPDETEHLLVVVTAYGVEP